MVGSSFIVGQIRRKISVERDRALTYLYLSVERKMVIAKSEPDWPKLNTQLPLKEESVEFNCPKGNEVSFRKMCKINNNSGLFCRKNMKIN